MGTDRSRYGWPALMRATTARDYLDGMPPAQFNTLVAQYLDARSIGNEVRFTRQSLDAWIDAGTDPRAARDRNNRVDGLERPISAAPSDVLERLALVPEEDFAALLGITVKTLKNRPKSELPEYVKAGRRWLFKESAVREYLSARASRDSFVPSRNAKGTRASATPRLGRELAAELRRRSQDGSV